MREFKTFVCLELALVFACISVASVSSGTAAESTDVTGNVTDKIGEENDVKETARKGAPPTVMQANKPHTDENNTSVGNVTDKIGEEENDVKETALKGAPPTVMQANKPHTDENNTSVEPTTRQKPTTARKKGRKSHTDKTTKKTQPTVSHKSSTAGKGKEKAPTDEATENTQPPKKSTEEEDKTSSVFEDLRTEGKPIKEGYSRRGFRGPKGSEHQSSHFAAFFLASIVLVFAIYVVYHNRQKVIAVVIEGRSHENGRRRGYRKLETNVHEAMPSMKNANSTYVY